MSGKGGDKSPLTPVLQTTPAALVGIGVVGLVTSAGLNPAAWAAVATGAAMIAGKIAGKGGD